MFWKFTFDKPKDTTPQGKIPVVAMTRAGLEAAEDRTLWRIGHSTVLMKLRHEFFLTDPIFSKRSSPVWFAGPKRFHAVPIGIKELPRLKAVILSHDHYDHLDRGSIKKLAKKVDWFVAPRGVGQILIGWGVDAAKVRELDWWQETAIESVRLTLTPTQHFSGRSMFNRNQTLFGSWVIDDAGFRIFYGGDSGYFDGFAEIGKKYGPFAVTLVENGAYNVRWPFIHMQPEETMQAHRDLGGGWLVPIHNGTFDLAMHAWTEPMERVQTLAAKLGVAVSTPRFGEPVRMMDVHAGSAWWRGVDGERTAVGLVRREVEPGGARG